MDATRCFYLVILNLFVIQHHVYAETWAKVKSEFSSIRDGADFTLGLDSVRPTADSTIAMNVTLDWNMVSINDFDETNGYMDVSGFITLEWFADTYDTAMDITELVKPNTIWKPPIVLVNSVKTYEVIGHDTSAKVRYNFKTKGCQWKPWVVARAACSPDVQYYPFDKQSCTFRLSVWGYKSDEVLLTSKNKEWTFLYFEENGEWMIDDTSVETSVVNNFSVIDFKMKMTRRPMYYIINLIAPVVLLSALSACTFLLPVGSGERVGFAITCFLSYVVLLNMIMGFLPTSALPLSYLSYYTFIMMIFSAAISIMTIVTIRVYHKSENDPIPGCIAGFYQCLTCWNVTGTLQNDKVVHIQREADDSEEEKVTWKRIATLIDNLLFLGLLGGQIFFSIAYLAPIFTNYM